MKKWYVLQISAIFTALHTALKPNFRYLFLFPATACQFSLSELSLILRNSTNHDLIWEIGEILTKNNSGHNSVVNLVIILPIQKRKLWSIICRALQLCRISYLSSLTLKLQKYYYKRVQYKSGRKTDKTGNSFWQMRLFYCFHVKKVQTIAIFNGVDNIEILQFFIQKSQRSTKFWPLASLWSEGEMAGVLKILTWPAQQ